MPTATHRFRYVIFAVLLSGIALLLLTRPAHGDWGARPFPVRAITAHPPAVAACDVSGCAHGG